MNNINLDQNTQEWLNMRKGFIGGSDTPSIMCVSPWRTPLQLWEEKLGICTPDQAEKAYIFDKGHRYEIIARNKFEMQIGYDIPPQIVQHDQIDFCRVSLDCFNRSKGFVGEIKFMGAEAWQLLRDKQIVPDHYYPQVQYQLLATGFKKNYFVGINDNKEIAFTTVRPDIEYIKKMVNWCSYFWNLVQTKVPPKFIELDYKKFSRKEGKKAAHRIFDIDKQIGDLLDERDQCQDVVLGTAKSTRMTFDDKCLIRVCDFDHKDLEQIVDLRGYDKKQLDRSIKDTLKLLIINRDFELGAMDVKK